MKKLLGLIAVVAVVFTLTMTVNMSNDQTEGTSEMIAYNIAEAQIIDPVWGVSASRYRSDIVNRNCCISNVISDQI